MAICAVKSGGLYNPEQSISTPNRLFRTIAVSGSLRLWLPAAPLGRRLEGTEWRVTLPIRTKKLKQRGLSSASRGQRSPCQLKRSRFRGERNSLLAQLMQSINYCLSTDKSTKSFDLLDYRRLRLEVRQSSLVDIAATGEAIFCRDSFWSRNFLLPLGRILKLRGHPHNPVRIRTK